MNSSLSFQYRFSEDGDDFGSLLASVQTPDFSGPNAMWVQWQDVEDFSASLSSYPIQADTPLACDWGYSENEEYVPITVVKIAPATATGALIADVFLADQYAPNNQCRTLFETDYLALANFKKALHQIMSDRYGVATLLGRKS